MAGVAGWCDGTHASKLVQQRVARMQGYSGGAPVIVALEGMDCAGKSTLLEALRPRIRAARFVQPLPLPKQLMPVMSWVEERQLALWTALYDSKTLYVCDRHVAVSAPVYDEYFGRPCVCEWRAWTQYVHVVYLAVLLGELHNRYAKRGDERFDGKFVKLQACYAK